MKHAFTLDDQPCGHSSSRPKLSVGKRKPYPVSEFTAAFRTTLPDLLAMIPGERHFVPALDDREDLIIKRECQKANRKTLGRFLLPLLEYRSHVRGKLIVCMTMERKEEWLKLREEMMFMMRVNRSSPPLDKNGNALVPNLPLT